MQGIEEIRRSPASSLEEARDVASVPIALPLAQWVSLAHANTRFGHFTVVGQYSPIPLLQQPTRLVRPRRLLALTRVRK